MPAYPLIDFILLNNLAVANFCIESYSVKFLLLPICPTSIYPGKLNLGVQSTIGLL